MNPQKVSKTIRKKIIRKMCFNGNKEKALYISLTITLIDEMTPCAYDGENN